MDKGKKQHKLLAAAFDDNYNEASVSDNDQKKMIRRETERQRRMQMSSLCDSLLSLLPFELIKGKHSVSDHIGEAASYIKDLEEKTHELQIKRDNLKHEVNSSLLDESSNHSKFVSIDPFPGGVEISIDSSLEESSFPLSLLLEILIQEGCNVVSCAYSQVNGRLYHSIKAEVDNLACLDLAGLQQKLNHVILYSRYSSE